MADNRVVVYKGPGEVAVEDIEYPKLEVPEEVASAMGMTVEAPHAVILRIVATNICGSDQHMVRGRTTAPVGQTLGHEITGEVIEKGNDVNFINEGDLCSVPFNIACGRCRNCKERKTGVCLNVNPARAGSAYGYVDMGGWTGGQAQYVMVPFADFNLLKFPDKEQAMEKILDLTMLSDIFPTGYHGCYTAGVTPGPTVHVAGAGPGGGFERHHDRRAGGRRPGHPGPLRDRRSGRGGPGGPTWHAQDPHRSRLGQEPPLHHRPVPGHEVQPGVDDGDPARQGPHRRCSERHGHYPGRSPRRLQGLRQGRGQVIRPQPARFDLRL